MALEAYADSVEPTPPQDLVAAPPVTVRLTHRIDEVASAWTALEAKQVESPGQTLAFTRAWAKALNIAQADQYYVTAEFDGATVALLPLRRRKRFGVQMLTWFAGAHVGCNTPLVDGARLAALGPTGRTSLWSDMIGMLKGAADLVYLGAMPQVLVGGADLYAELGESVATETLYRAQFSSWDEADKTQRSKSRRKHDRQQGERLDGLGQVSFEEIRGTLEALPILDAMFRQRAARFVKMGVRDPFVEPGIREFYDSTLAAGSGIDVRLHVLRLDGEIVATRYNIPHGDRLFCLISSMSDDCAIQAGSPGKQCLLRVMQTAFEAGYRMFDMGAGFTDEKRHWCNVQVALRQHYVPLTAVGTVAAKAHAGWQVLRQRLKANRRVMGMVKAVRGRMLKVKAGVPAED